jgi:multidrug efflux system membrane fusion protein
MRYARCCPDPERASSPADAFDRAGTTHLTSGTVLYRRQPDRSSTGTVRLKAVFDNHDHALFRRGSLQYQVLADTLPSQLVVPTLAVPQGPQGSFVYVVRDGKAVVRPVQIGLTQGERTSLTTGVDAGDVVVTDGVDRLRDGASVDVRQ